MTKFTTAAALTGLVLASAVCTMTTASAQSRIVPEGDTVEFTPPIDLTPGQVQRARPRDRAVLEGRSTYIDRRGVQHRIAPDEDDIGVEGDR